MSRKDYIAIAEAIAKARRRVHADAVALDAISIVTDEIGSALGLDNPAFDFVRFEEYIKEHAR